MQVSAEDGRLQPNRFFFLALPEDVLETCTDSEQKCVCLLLAFQAEEKLHFWVRGTGILDRAVCFSAGHQNISYFWILRQVNKASTWKKTPQPMKFTMCKVSTFTVKLFHLPQAWLWPAKGILVSSRDLGESQSHVLACQDTLQWWSISSAGNFSKSFKILPSPQHKGQLWFSKAAEQSCLCYLNLEKDEFSTDLLRIF